MDLDWELSREWRCCRENRGVALFPLSGKGFTSIVSDIQIFIKVTLLIIIMCPKITFSFFYAPSFQATTFIDINRTMLSRSSELHSFIYMWYLAEKRP